MDEDHNFIYEFVIAEILQ